MAPGLIVPHLCVMHALRLVMDKKLGAEEVGGREYWWDPDDRDKHIRVPRSNAPKPRWEGQRKTIWDSDAIETDKYDLQDSPSDSELLGADEDDADDYSDDSMELPQCQKRFTTRLKRLSAN
jgi:hypothetical protein